MEPLGEYSVKVLFPDQTIKDCLIAAFDSPYDKDEWKLIISGLAPEPKSYMSQSLFHAMCELRKDLEKTHCKLLCAGARTDSHPSGMSLDMGGGEKTYILRIGEPGKQKDLVSIFDYAEPDLIGTVEAQEEYYDRWIKSLGR